MSPRALPLLAASALVLTGCATRLMPTPAAIHVAGVNPFSITPDAHKSPDTRVFVASAREPAGAANPARFYSTDRSREVRLGVATVEIGPGMTWDEIRTESLSETRSRNPAIRLRTYEEFGELWTTVWPTLGRLDKDWDFAGVDREPAERFARQVDGVLDDSVFSQVTVFVHGFNTTFAGNLEIAAEFWHYLGRDDVMISFNWASRGDLFSYQKDKANAEFAQRQFRVFLEFLARETTADRINVIAHSAGNGVVVGAMHALALRCYDKSDEEARAICRLGRVVLAAPDVDLDVLINAGVDGARRIVQDLSIYASRHDRALALSSGIFGDVRVGRSIGRLAPDQITRIINAHSPWIDVTYAQKRRGSILGHSYYHQNPWVSTDVMLFLRLGATPRERGLVRDESTGFLVFPPDYESRLPDVVRALRDKYRPESSQSN